MERGKSLPPFQGRTVVSGTGLCRANHRLVDIAFHPVKPPAFAALQADRSAHIEGIIMFETIIRALLSICAIAVCFLSIWELGEVEIMAPAMLLKIQLLVILVLVAVLLILWFRTLDQQRVRAGSDVKAFSAATDSAAQSSQTKFLASQMQEAAFTKQIDQLASNASQITDKLDNLRKTIDDNSAAADGAAQSSQAKFLASQKQDAAF